MNNSVVKQVNINSEIFEITFEELLTKYMPLIKSRAYTWSTPYISYEDYCQVGSIALWKAFNYYKMPFNFTSIANKFIHYEFLSFYAKNKKYYTNVVSLESSVYTNKDGSEIELIDTLGEEDKNILSYAEVESAKRLLEMLSERQRDEIVSLAVDEEKRKVLAEKYRMSVPAFRAKAIATMNRYRTLFISEGV